MVYRMVWNGRRGTMTSAIWNVIERSCRAVDDQKIEGGFSTCVIRVGAAGNRAGLTQDTMFLTAGRVYLKLMS